jgi:hypothetical protein
MTAASDPRARELARVWAAGGKQHVALDINLWKDPAAWGIMLVDLAKHVASGDEFTDVLTRIKEGFDAEWEAATDTPSGEFQD